MLVAAPAAAQAPEAVPPRLAARVATAIGEQWGVAPAEVRLAWGRVSSSARIAPTDSFRLVGRGEDGWFAVLIGPEARPVAVRLRAGTMEATTVAARPIGARRELEPADLRTDRVARWGAPEREPFVPTPGWITTRAFRAGDVITPSGVSAPPAVRAGEPVRVGWSSGRVSVELSGVALAAGAVGETITVRLVDRAGQRRARVTGPGTVSLDS